VSYVLALLGGFFIEATAVFWVHYSERNRRGPLRLVSTLQGAALAAGVGASHDLRHGAAFVAGYVLGADIASRLKVA
jgi:hypothetical protein